ncbi:5625_t:CDS:2, partial [Dentiscutata heterogama]
PEPVPNSNKAMFKSINIYLEDLEQNIHTSKAMYSVLIAAFSGYGIYSMVAKLGVRFLDKLEQNVDYHATCRVLELIHTA